MVCGSVKGRLCWEKLGNGRSKCIRWGNKWVTPIEFGEKEGRGGHESENTPLEW